MEWIRFSDRLPDISNLSEEPGNRGLEILVWYEGRPIPVDVWYTGMFTNVFGYGYEALEGEDFTDLAKGDLVWCPIIPPK